MVSPGSMRKLTIAQDPVLAFVGEPDVVELDRRLLNPDGGRSCRIDDLGLGVEKLEDALGCRHRGLQDVVLFAEILDGPEEPHSVLEERHQHAERHLAVPIR